MTKRIIVDDKDFKMWESWYGLLAYGENKFGSTVYKWSFIFMNRSFFISVLPKSWSFAIQVTDLYHWEPNEGPPEIIFLYHN